MCLSEISTPKGNPSLQEVEKLGVGGEPVLVHCIYNNQEAHLMWPSNACWKLLIDQRSGAREKRHQLSAIM